MRVTFGYRRSVDPASQTGKGVFILFLCLGILFLLGAAAAGVIHTQRIQRRVKTEAVIVGFGRSGTNVRYDVDGVSYTEHLNVSSSSFRVGQKIPVAYDPENPNDAISAGVLGYLASIILGFIGFVFALVGGISLKTFHGKKREEAPQDDLPDPW